jgi:hypothetical protein
MSGWTHEPDSEEGLRSIWLVVLVTLQTQEYFQF